MATIESGSLAVATIFEYPEPLEEEKFTEWIDDLGYSILKPASAQLTFGDQDVPVQTRAPNLGEKEDLQIFYNSESNLPGYSDSSFVTVKTGDVDEFDLLIEELDTIKSGLDEFDVSDQIGTYELTIEGKIRVDSDHDLMRYFDDEAVDTIEDVRGVPMAGQAIKFGADVEPSDEGWYQFLIDTESAPNPKRWAFKFICRYDDISNIGWNDIEETVDAVVNITKIETR